MRVCVARPSELGTAELQRWRELQALSVELDNAFLSPEFALAVERVSTRCRVAVLRGAGELLGFLPFERVYSRIGRAIAYGVSDAQALVCPPGLQVDPAQVVRACGLSVLEYDHLVCGLGRFASGILEVSNSPVMDLRGGYAGYLAETGRCQHRWFRSASQKKRKLVREHGELEFEFATRDPLVLAWLVKLKSEQYARTGRGDRFARRWIRDLAEELLGSEEVGCRGALSTLRAGGRLIAAHLGIRNQTRLSGWFPVYDADFAQYSPGLQLFLALAEAAPAQGLSLIDLGKGQEPYKEWLRSWAYPVAGGRVTTSGLAYLASRAHARSQRAFDGFVSGHPGVRAALPPELRRVDRVPVHPRLRGARGRRVLPPAALTTTISGPERPC